jgi:nucleoid-associated protein YgaU
MNILYISGNFLFLLLKDYSTNMDLKTFLKSLKLQESTISMIVGVIVILLVGFLAVRYVTKDKTGDVLPSIETQTEESDLPTIHQVEDGETLWSISEKYYGTGYNWIDIKEANELTNADEIEKDQELTIPNVTPRILAEANTMTVSPTQEPTDIPERTEEITETSKPEETEGIEEPNSQSSSTYTVKSGDSLWKIAQANLGDGNKWTEIAKNNDIKTPSIIRTGQELKLSEVKEGSITDEAASTSATSYTVVKGDSLWSIAQGTYGDSNQWIKIAKANNLKHPSLIHPGNSLIIPE